MQIYIKKPLNKGAFFKGYLNKGFILILNHIFFDMVKEKKEKSKEVLLLAERIKSLRKKSGYTSYEIFAYDHNITRSQWGRYEKGEDIRFTSLVRICNIFKMSLEDFFSEGFNVS